MPMTGLLSLDTHPVTMQPNSSLSAICWRLSTPCPSISEASLRWSALLFESTTLFALTITATVRALLDFACLIPAPAIPVHNSHL